MDFFSEIVRYPGHHPSVPEHVISFCRHLAGRGYRHAAGRHRITFAAPCRRMVVKVPHCEDGMHANGYEARAWLRYVRGRSGIPIAGCRTFWADREIGVPMLVMRHVDIAPSGPPPRWADWIDCAQYGQDRHGRLVAYDL